MERIEQVAQPEIVHEEGDAFGEPVRPFEVSRATLAAFCGQGSTEGQITQLSINCFKEAVDTKRKTDPGEI